MNDSDVLDRYPAREETCILAGRTYRMILPADQDALLDDPRTHARFAQDEYMPYWAQPWPASRLLIEYLVKHKPSVTSRVVELGAGLGLLSLVLRDVLGWSMIASDYEEDALAFARHNAHLNKQPPLETCSLDFRNLPEQPCWDAVVGADLLYETRLVAPLADWLARALTSGGRAWICDPCRSAADGFPACLERLGLSVDRVNLDNSDAGQGSRGRVWFIRKVSSQGSVS